MMATSDLIDSLAADAIPVRRLRSPLRRAGLWMLFAAAIVTLLAFSHEIRPDLVSRLHEARYVLGLAGSLATGVLATLAAFMIGLPDRSRLWIFLPVPALAFWVATIGYQCLEWVDLAPHTNRVVSEARCFSLMVLASLPMSMSMLVMLRHAAALRPVETTLVAGLAVAAIAASALAIFHNHDASVLTLLWNVGSMAFFVGLAGLYGRRMLTWVAPRPPLTGWQERRD